MHLIETLNILLNNFLLAIEEMSLADTHHSDTLIVFIAKVYIKLTYLSSENGLNDMINLISIA